MPRTRNASQLEIFEATQVMDTASSPDIRFSPWELTQCILPQRRPADTTRAWTRSAGDVQVLLTAGTNADGSNVGLPSGSRARLLIADWSSRAIRTKSPVIDLGPSMNGYMGQLGLASTGGKTGSRTRVGEELVRLVESSFKVMWPDDDPEKRYRGARMIVASAWDVWWGRSNNPSHPTEPSTIVLGDQFFQWITDSPVPLYFDALRILDHSALAMDLYMWLAARLPQLRRPVSLTWAQLAVQFGNGPIPEDPKKRARMIYDVKRDILGQLPAVLRVYHDARVQETPDGLLLSPSREHVPPRGQHGLYRAHRAATVDRRRLEAIASDKLGGKLLPTQRTSEQPALPM